VSWQTGTQPWSCAAGARWNQWQEERPKEGVIDEHADTQRLPWPRFGEMADWLETAWTMLRPITAHPLGGGLPPGRPLRHPGRDFWHRPGKKDVEVTVAKGILTIKAERHEEAVGKQHIKPT
jgi:hypothetical protein